MALMFTCDLLDPTTGSPCTFTSKRKFNWDRHLGRKHKEKMNDGFIQYFVGDHGVLQKGICPPPTTAATTPAANFGVVGNRSDIPYLLLPDAGGSTSRTNSNINIEPQPLQILTDGQVPNSSTDHKASHPRPEVVIRIHTAIPAAQSTNTVTVPNLLPSQLLAATDRNLSDANPNTLPQSVDTVTNLKDTPLSYVELISGDLKSAPVTPWQQRKDRSRKRLSESTEKEPLPIYQVKRSKTWPLQQRGIK